MEKELGKAETGQLSAPRSAPAAACLAGDCPHSHHPSFNNNPMLIKAFFFFFSWSRLSGAATHRCLEKPRSSRGRLSCAPSIRRPAATPEEIWWVPAGGCSPGASPCCFLHFFHHIWLLPANSRPGGGEERDVKGFTMARAKGQSVPVVRSRAGARAEKAFPLARLFMYREHN